MREPLEIFTLNGCCGMVRVKPAGINAIPAGLARVDTGQNLKTAR
jgi:hypothetical protein